MPTARSAPKNESCGLRIWPQPPSLPITTVIGRPKRTAVSISMPLSPKAPSPAISSTRWDGRSSLAAIANDGPDAEAAEGPGIEPLARARERHDLGGAAHHVAAVAHHRGLGVHHRGDLVAQAVVADRHVVREPLAS